MGKDNTIKKLKNRQYKLYSYLMVMFQNTFDIHKYINRLKIQNEERTKFIRKFRRECLNLNIIHEFKIPGPRFDTAHRTKFLFGEPDDSKTNDYTYIVKPTIFRPVPGLVFEASLKETNSVLEQKESTNYVKEHRGQKVKDSSWDVDMDSMQYEFDELKEIFEEEKDMNVRNIEDDLKEKKYYNDCTEFFKHFPSFDLINPKVADLKREEMIKNLPYDSYAFQILHSSHQLYLSNNDRLSNDYLNRLSGN
jgi:hypothetical protein